MLGLLILSAPARAWLGDDGTYTWSRSSTADPDSPAHTWVDVPNTPGAVELLRTFDEVESMAGIWTTPVSFYGRTYAPDQVNASTYGLVLFGGQGDYQNPYCCGGQPVPAPAIREPAIQAFWATFLGAGVGAMWAVETADEKIVHWEDSLFPTGGVSNDFQVALRVDGSFRISWASRGTPFDTVAVGAQRDWFGGNQVFFGNAPLPMAPVTWLFVPDAVDDDGDGFTEVDDCDDADPSVNGGVVDDLCDGVVVGCGPPFWEDDVDFDGLSSCAGDCDDTANWVSPYTPEVCDGSDNNCDGQVDEGQPTSTWFEDRDFDGSGNPDGVSVDACFTPFGYGAPGDCDDDDPSIGPFFPEDCDPTVDRNCDGDPILNASNATPYQLDGDGDGFGVAPTLFACIPPMGATNIPGDCDDEDPMIRPGVAEVPFDGIDQNCDGYEDQDRDQDGMSDADEYVYGSDWLDPDSDDDGAVDGREFLAGSDLLLADSDGDGVGDADELGALAAPTDTDGDGLIDALDDDDDGDGWPTAFEGVGDFDGDGQPDHVDTDSDGDGIADLDETEAGRLRFDAAEQEPDDCGCRTSGGAPHALALLAGMFWLRRPRRVAGPFSPDGVPGPTTTRTPRSPGTAG